MKIYNQLNDSEIKFIEPCLEYKKSYLEALKEQNIKDKDNIDIEKIDKDFDSFLDKTQKIKKGLIKDYLPGTKYWCIKGDKYIGNINYRPKLNDQFEFRGGNIGYLVRPSERRKGYASVMLEYVLNIAKRDGLPLLLITCDDDNIGSKKVIEKAGGVYKNSDVYEGVKFNRYIISLAD
jgi:predicted acetyltransferase